MTRRVSVNLAAPVAALLSCAGCDRFGKQSALRPAGEQAGQILGLFNLYLVISTIVYALVLIAFAVAIVKGLRRRRASTNDRPEPRPDPDGEHRMARVVSSAVGVTIVILFVLLIGEFATGRQLHEPSKEPNPLVVRVTGHQWWWEVTYADDLPSNVVMTANEIHLPVGRTVKVELASTDVIHSFWVPNLHGKKDMIPGYPTSTWIQPTQIGTFWGQCAEYCGHQHAHMRFPVVVEEPAKFDAWLAAQRQSAPDPSTPEETRGQQVFLSNTCVTCHTIQGTTAAARVGPTLTHLASRLTIAAGTLPNTTGHRAGWIVDPQRIKPGVRMPQNPLSADDLKALLTYLETLK